MRGFDLTNDTVGALRVLWPADGYDCGSRRWVCLCGCGLKVTFPSRMLVRDNGPRSCGCAATTPPDLPAVPAEIQGIIERFADQLRLPPEIAAIIHGEIIAVIREGLACGERIPLPDIGSLIPAMSPDGLTVRLDPAATGEDDIHDLLIAGFDDLRGKEFNRWRVVSLHTADANASRRRWLCRCRCGVERPIIERQLIEGRSRSCKCLKHQEARERALKAAEALVGGPPFGLWEVVAVIGIAGKGKPMLVRCRCKGCDREFPVRVAALKNGTSLGCVGCRKGKR